jgi:hypothetical protein
MAMRRRKAEAPSTVDLDDVRFALDRDPELQRLGAWPCNTAVAVRRSSRASDVVTLATQT